MTIIFDKKADRMDVSLEGRLDTISAPEFESFLSENSNGINALTINCEKLVYVSSAGLRVLLAAQKKMKGTVKLTNVCELVMEVLDITGFTDIFVIE